MDSKRLIYQGCVVRYGIAPASGVQTPLAMCMAGRADIETVASLKPCEALRGDPLAKEIDGRAQ